MTHVETQKDNEEKKVKQYYHNKHLGSEQFVTDWKGRYYEHIEYTPYGELWTYKSKTAMLFLTTYNNFLAKQPAGLIEETAPGVDKLPFRFTGKELDTETGLYYYGARYLDPKYSRWLSGDPAVGEYIPSPGTEPNKLAGMGGVYNTTNLQVFNYGNNNPIKYNDPDGKKIKDAIKFFKWWFSYNLTKGLSAGNHNIQSPVYNPIYEKANDIVETIYNVEEQIHSSYIQGLTFISDASGAAHCSVYLLVNLKLPVLLVRLGKSPMVYCSLIV